jgi:uncharacterized Zn finger protein
VAWRFDDYGRFFPPSRPRAAKGGIKAQSQRGGFGKSWWAQRWIRVLEGFDLGARLRRGRSYARSGQVLDVAIDKGVVRSSVQGSRPKPYVVTLQVKALSVRGWKKLATVLAAEARFTAKLLAGEMPEDVEKAFDAAGLSLFPERLQDLATECSCPDWSNPCKHIAAVYYLLGEEFDRDPFLIFKLRGLPREDLVGLLGTAGVRRPGRADPRAEEAAASAAPTEPLRPHPSAFWEGGTLPADLFSEVQIPAEPAALLKRLAAFPFWRGSAALAAALEPAYVQASARGLDAFMGTRSGG